MNDDLIEEARREARDRCQCYPQPEEMLSVLDHEESCNYYKDRAHTHFGEKDDEDLDGPMTPREESEFQRRWPVECALDAAHVASEQAGEGHLAACLVALSFFWDLGGPGIERAATILKKEAVSLRAMLSKPETGTVHDPGDGSIPVYFPGPGETDAFEEEP